MNNFSPHYHCPFHDSSTGPFFHNDHFLFCLLPTQFSDCEKYLLYIAEKKKPKHETFLDPFGKTTPSKPDEASSSSSSSSKPQKGEKYTYVEEWGEQLVGKSRPVICVLVVSDGTIKVLADEGDHPCIPGSVSPGQAIWTNQGKGIVFVGFDHSVERLGIIYCPIRPSRLYYVDLKVGLLVFRCVLASL